MDSEDEFENRGYDEDENHEDDFQTWTMKDSVIFLIDCGESMFEMSNNEVPFQNSLKCAISTISDKIISSHSDLVGVCFYGTRENLNTHDIENVMVFQDLDKPDAQKIVDLENLLKIDFQSTYGSCKNTEFPFGDALWASALMFSDCKVKVGVKRIFIFTNQDNPNKLDSNARDAIQKAKDLHVMGIDIELFSINKQGELFNPNKFYAQIFSLGDEIDLKDWRSSQSLTDLHNHVRPCATKKRSSGKLMLTIFDSLQIGVAVYSLVNETKKGSAVPIDPETKTPLQKKSILVGQQTREIVSPDEIAYQYQYGGEGVNFDKQQINEIRYPYRPGITLLGFKPQTALEPYHNLAHSYFLYPDEHIIEGSTTAFCALLTKMLTLKRIAIVRISARENSPPKMAALVPQEEKLDDDNNQIMPSGFHVIYLPYADDLRDIEIEKSSKASKEQVEKARKVVQGLRIDFDSRNFQNPALQKHYANLQDLAMGREIREEVIDYAIPDTEGMMEFQEEIVDFKDAVLPSFYAPDVKKTPGAKTPVSKRKREDDENSPPGSVDKKRKVVDEVDWENLVAENKLNTATIVEMKIYCSNQGLKNYSSKTKLELMEIVKKSVLENSNKNRNHHTDENDEDNDMVVIKQSASQMQNK
jgi:ATP-dependent DNA helicase 2 subunit 1